MEKNSEIKMSVEKQKKPEPLKVGDTFELPEEKTVLLGRADRLIEGAYVYQIKELKKNPYVSNFGLALKYNSSGHSITVSKPNLELDGKIYESTNRITIENTSREFVEVEDSYDSGVGLNIYKIYVGDEGAQNGFLLELVGGDRMKLIGAISEGKNL